MTLRKMMGAGLVALGIAALSASAAAAADGWVRAGGESATQAQRAIGSAVCRTVLISILRSDNVGASNTSTAFGTIPNATAAVSTSGARCIKVLFTSETVCRATTAADFCYLRALVNGVPMNPNDSVRAIDSESSTARGHAYEWFLQVDSTAAVTYTVAIQGRVGSSATTFIVDDWTLAMEVTTR